MPGYNDTRTGRGNAFVKDREGGAYYARTWEAAIASNPDWVIVNSWNEWPEGTYIEPSQAYGDQYLGLTAEWAGRFKSGAPIAYTAPAAPAVAPPALSTPHLRQTGQIGKIDSHDPSPPASHAPRSHPEQSSQQ